MARRPSNGSSALAREIGVTPSAVSQKLKRGMSAEEIRAEWRAKQTVGQADARKVGRPYTPARTLQRTGSLVIQTIPDRPAPTPVSIPSARVPVLPSTAYPDEETDLTSDKPNLRDAQTRNQLALAQKNELDLLERHGLLVVNSKIAKREADRIIWARDTLLRLPGELADGLAAETNPAKCLDMLDRELRRILERLAGYYLNPASDPNVEPIAPTG